MAAYTQTTTGNWSSTATWGGSGPPGSGDTATVNANITVDVNTTVGSSPSTGGTAAITFVSNTLTFTIATGVTLTVLGDIKSTAPLVFFTMNAGAQLITKPPSGQQYQWNLTSAGHVLLTINGSSGSHCVIKTDTSSGGLSCWMNPNFGLGSITGIIVATYTDFLDYGDVNNMGILSWDASDPHTFNITNCTFTRCNYWFRTNQDSTVLFQDNSFASSVLTSHPYGGAGSCAAFGWDVGPTSGTRVINRCSFDGALGNGGWLGAKLTNCVVLGNFIASSGSWPDDTYFNNNFLENTTGTTSALLGSSKNCYYYASGGGHYVGISGSTVSLTGCIFESGNNAGTDDCVAQATTGTVTFKYNLVLPSGGTSGSTSGKLVATPSATSPCIVEHNTYASKNGETGLVGLGEAASTTSANTVLSCRANIVWSPGSPAVEENAIYDQSTTPGVDAVVLAGYNGFLHPLLGTDKYNTSTSQSNVPGYNKLVVSNANPYPNAQIGTGDFTADPQFVDSSRNLGSWGATQGGDGTAASAIAILSANPSLIGQATTGLLAWVRNGWRPQNTAYKATSYPGDASTADANGNAWPGAGPDVGAMAWQSAVTGGPLPFFDAPAHSSFNDMGL